MACACCGPSDHCGCWVDQAPEPAQPQAAAISARVEVPLPGGVMLPVPMWRERPTIGRAVEVPERRGATATDQAVRCSWQT